MADKGKSTEELLASLDDIQSAAEGVTEATMIEEPEKPAVPLQVQGLGFLADVSLSVTVEVGRARMTIQDILQLGQGSVIELTKLAGEPLDIFVNNKQVARGEAVIVNEKFGVRLTDIIAPEDRIGSIGK
jgi:flagellar motor switch protein FliN/FliY